MAERLGASGVDDDSVKDFSVFSRGIFVLVSEIASVSRACNARSTSVQRAFHVRETLAISSSGTEMTVSGMRRAVSGTENDPSGTTIFRQYVLTPNS